MKPGILEFKCRRCGNDRVPRLLEYLTEAWFNNDHNARSFHECEDGGYGISDLIGGKKVKDNV